MADQTEDRLLDADHDFDGIQEYDNPMPRWWLWIFYASIAFVPLYLVLPGRFGAGKGAVAEYEAEVAAYQLEHPPSSGGLITDEAVLAFSRDPRVVADGRAIFATNCAVCHRPDGGGLIGPNLADDSWIHGDAPAAIHLTIAEGVLTKGMPAWARILKPDQVNAVAAYVLTLKGTNPPAPKPPEGVVSASKPSGE